MGALTDPAAMLTAWESAAAQVPLARGPVLVARPTDPSDALDLPLGEVARRAVREYIDTFGDVVDVTVACAECNQVLDLVLSLTDVAGTDVGDDGGGWSAVHGAELMARSPTTRDLIAASRDQGGDAILMERCVRDLDGHRAQVNSLTLDQRDAVDTDLERRNAAAAVVLRADCASCGADVTAALDPGALLWEQVQAAVPALLTEIATLASAFGWTEDVVLSLSPARRRAYLDLVAAS
jgi:hypothetical protein